MLSNLKRKKTTNNNNTKFYTCRLIFMGVQIISSFTNYKSIGCDSLVSVHLEKNVIMTVTTPEKCNRNVHHHQNWTSVITKGTTVTFCKTLLLTLLGIQLSFKNLSKAVLTFAYILSIPKPQRKEILFLTTAHVFQTTNSWLIQFWQCSKPWHKHLHLERRL